MALAGKRVIDFHGIRRWIYQIFINDLQAGCDALDWDQRMSQTSWIKPSLISNFAP
jgi:hypothetical protein